MVTAAVGARVDATFRDAAAAWHAALSEGLPSLVEQWRLRLGDVLPGGWNSVVLVCDMARGRAVLKLALRPDAVLLEARAFRHWGTDAAAGVLACDPRRGALLMERLKPATPMEGSTENVAAAARLLGRLHRRASVPAALPSLADAYADAGDRRPAMWRRSPHGIPRAPVARAARWLQARSTAPVPRAPVLLHGGPTRRRHRREPVTFLDRAGNAGGVGRADARDRPAAEQRPYRVSPLAIG